MAICWELILCMHACMQVYQRGRELKRQEDMLECGGKMCVLTCAGLCACAHVCAGAKAAPAPKSNAPPGKEEVSEGKICVE